MKKLIFTFLVIIVSLDLIAQNIKTFDSKYLLFSYPAKYKTTSIENAPHMLLKLESKNDFFSISIGRIEFNAIDAWDDNFYEEYKKSLDKQDCVSLEKITINTQSGIRHFLKSKINYSSNGLRMLNYIYIYNRYMYVFGHISFGTYSKYSSTKEVDDLMKGVYFKDFDNSNYSSIESNLNYERKDLFSKLHNKIKSMNNSLPMPIDDITCLTGIILIDKCITCRYIVNTDDKDIIDKFSDKQLTKHVANISFMNFKNSLSDKFLKILSSEGIYIKHLFFDKGGKLITSFDVKFDC